MPALEDRFGNPLPPVPTIYLPENSTGRTNGKSGDDVIIGTDGRT